MRIGRPHRCLAGIYVVSAAILTSSCAHAWAADQPLNQPTVVTVVNKEFTPARPVPGVRIAISFFDGSEKITDARDRTNSHGQVQLVISPAAQARGDLRIEITEAQDLVIYQPGEGLLTAIPTTLTVALLPKGSPALLEPAQIEAMLNRMSRLTLQNQQLRAVVAKEQNEKPSIDQLLRDWAQQNGFQYDEVDQKVHSWAADILSHRQSASLSQQAEAELGLRHFDNAATLFSAAANTSDDALAREEKEFLDQRHTELRNSLQARMQSARAYQLARHFPDATAQVIKAQALAALEHQHYPDDSVFRELWLWASIMADATRIQEAKANLAQDNRQTFAAIAQDLADLLPQIDKTTDPQIWGYTQFFQGATLLYLANGSNDRDAAAFIAGAVAAVRAAAEIYDKTNDPSDWGAAQEGLGLILAYAGARQNGPDSLPSIRQAVAAFQAALTVASRSSDPKRWAGLEADLGGALSLQAMRANDATSIGLTEQAVAAMRASLEAFNKNDDPDGWAGAQDSLARALDDQALMAPDSQAVDLYAQAVAAYRSALEIRTKDKDPSKWASTLGAMSTALEQQAAHTAAPAANDLLRQSADACRDELTVITKDASPQAWALIQWDLGTVLLTEGKQTPGPPGLDLLAHAADANRAALQIYTKAGDPGRWARAQFYLASALSSQGERTQDSNAAQLLQQSIDAFRSALEVFTRTGEPQQWGQTQADLGETLSTLGVRTAGPQSADLLAQGAQAFRSALEIFTQVEFPRPWAILQADLGRALANQAQRTTGPAAAPIVTEAVTALNTALAADPNNPDLASTLGSIDHESLLDFPRAYDLISRAEQADPSVSNRLNLAEASLTVSKFQQCVDLLNSIDLAQEPARDQPAVQTLRLACQFGADPKSAAPTAAAFSAYKSGIERTGWTTDGDRHYLASAPQFSATRSSWIVLFQSLETGDGAALADAASRIAQSIKTTP